jgi:hypothetical protein
MSEDILLKAGEVEFTMRICRFGLITCQVANIGSVAVYLQKKLNLIAVIMFALAIAFTLYAVNLNGPR